MRRGLVVLIPTFLLWVPLCLPGQSSSRVTPVEKVAEGIWTATTSQGSNASWFLLGDEVIAIDTGGDAATGKEVLEKIRETAGKPVRYVVITHAHGDHAGGVSPFVEAGAQVVCHENAAPGIAALVEASARPRAGLVALSERFSFVGGTRRASIYFLGPAHTKGDLVVYLPDDKVLFPGDLALSGRAPYMQSPDVDPKGWENILERLVRLNFDKIVPGHGPVGTRQALADTFAYVRKVNGLSQTLIVEKVPDDQIEARLRQPNSGIDPAAITPELLSNIRGVIRAEMAKSAAAPAMTPAPTPAAKTSQAPAKKKG